MDMNVYMCAQGLAWLFLGVANSDSLLYDEEFQIYKSQVCVCVCKHVNLRAVGR